MILNSRYISSDGGEQKPCPFCGSTDTTWSAGGPYSYDHIYCNHCLTEFTFYPPLVHIGLVGLGCLKRWSGGISEPTQTQTGVRSAGARRLSSKES